MKIRFGFISNSSSSSFIVGFKKRPQSVEEVHEILFGKEPSYIEMYGHGLSTMEAAQRVFEDIQNQRSATVEQIRDTAGSGWFPGHPDYHYDDNTESYRLEREFLKKFPNEEHYNSDKISNPKAKELAERIRKARRVEWDEEHRKREEALEEYVKSILPKYTGEVYLFEYSDHEDCVMEHGDIFHNVPHEIINKH